LNIIDNKRLKKDIDIVIFNLMMMI
jgi:hypothetical protein